MAQFLYVCSFSNGSIKVGRSIDPESRIAQHEARVACLDVLLTERFVVQCFGPVVSAETVLIQKCIENATSRAQSEWFTGLNFNEVCEWASQSAAAVPSAERVVMPDGKIDFRGVIRSLAACGINQIDMAKHCRCSQPSISDIATGRTQDPSYSIGAGLMELHEVASAPYRSP